MLEIVRLIITKNNSLLCALAPTLFFPYFYLFDTHTTSISTAPPPPYSSMPHVIALSTIQPQSKKQQSYPNFVTLVYRQSEI